MSASSFIDGDGLRFDNPGATVSVKIPVSETEGERVAPVDCPIPVLAWILSRWLVVEDGKLKMRESFDHD